MKRIARFAGIVLSIAVWAHPVWAARTGQEGPMFKGDWNPRVGSGAEYQMEQTGQPPMSWEVAVVGQEAGGYWVETRMTAPEEVITKALIVPGAIQRMIVKAGGQPAMELPAMTAGQGIPQTDLKETARLIGKESVSTPAGTFSCDHYQLRERGGTTDVWVTSQISPYGLVKVSGPETRMVLSRLITGAWTRITETPQKIEMPGMADLSDMMKQMEEGQR